MSPVFHETLGGGRMSLRAPVSTMENLTSSGGATAAVAPDSQELGALGHIALRAGGKNIADGVAATRQGQTCSMWSIIGLCVAVRATAAIVRTRRSPVRPAEYPTAGVAQPQRSALGDHRRLAIRVRRVPAAQECPSTLVLWPQPSALPWTELLRVSWHSTTSCCRSDLLVVALPAWDRSLPVGALTLPRACPRNTGSRDFAANAAFRGSRRPTALIRTDCACVPGVRSLRRHGIAELLPRIAAGEVFAAYAQSRVGWAMSEHPRRLGLAPECQRTAGALFVAMRSVVGWGWGFYHLPRSDPRAFRARGPETARPRRRAVVCDPGVIGFPSSG